MFDDFKEVDMIKELRANGLNVDCAECSSPVSKRIIKDGLCPDCRKLKRSTNNA